MPDPDALRPFKGLMWGLAFATIFWSVLIALAVWRLG